MSTTLATLLRAASSRLDQAGIPDAPRDARLLLSHAAGIQPDRLTLYLPDAPPEGTAARLEAALARRVARQPVSQIIGWRRFWGREFEVTPDVLDPRPETETLVAAAASDPFDRLLDLGTGTGCIAISLLAENPAATGLAVDRSEAALRVASRNVARHDLSSRLSLAVSDWFSAVEGTFDLIVSNPPYISASDLAGLAPEVRDHEPHGALSDGGDGLSAYRAIAKGVGAVLRPAGRVLVEVGQGQAGAVSDLFSQAGLVNIALHPDMDGRERVVMAHAP